MLGGDVLGGGDAGDDDTAAGSAAPDAAGGASGFARIMLGSELKFSSNLTVVALYAITFLLVGIGLIMVLCRRRRSPRISTTRASSAVSGTGHLRADRRAADASGVTVSALVLEEVGPGGLGFGVFLHPLVFTPLGVEVWGNRNWIQIGGFGGQPSEDAEARADRVDRCDSRGERTAARPGETRTHSYRVSGCVACDRSRVGGRDLGTAMIMGAAVLGAMIFGGLNRRTIGLTIAGMICGRAHPQDYQPQPNGTIVQFRRRAL